MTWYTHQYDEAEAYVNDKYAFLYQGIFRANQVIEGLSKLQEDRRPNNMDRADGPGQVFQGAVSFLCAFNLQ